MTDFGRNGKDLVQMISFGFSDQIVYLLSKYNKLTFECQTMKQVDLCFVRMEVEINDKGNKPFLVLI